MPPRWVAKSLCLRVVPLTIRFKYSVFLPMTWNAVTQPQTMEVELCWKLSKTCGRTNPVRT